MNTLPYRLLALDLDGTLLDSRGEVSAVNREALHRAHAAGLVVCICTGRSVTESRTVIEQIGLDLSAGVFVFGAIVADLEAERVICRNTMSAQLADGLIGYLQERGHFVLVLYDGSQAGCDYVLVEGSHNHQAYEKWLSVTPARAERVPRWQPRACSPLRIGIIEEPARVEQTLHELHREFPAELAKINSIYAPNYGLHVVECFAPVVNKWYGICQLAGQLGIAKEQIAAVGDDINDLEMISNAGLGVAMANAISPIKAAAARATLTNDEHGVAALIDSLVPR